MTRPSDLRDGRERGPGEAGRPVHEEGDAAAAARAQRITPDEAIAFLQEAYKVEVQ